MAEQQEQQVQPPLNTPLSPGVSHCDLVMKGGITSGVIYPRLVSDLSAQYVFKNIGGTSAGAIAAGASAAAEYGRQHGNAGAFAALAKLPEMLGEALPGGRTRLFTLFQPVPALRRHFDVLVGALNRKPVAAVASVLTGMVAMQLGLTLLIVLVGGLLLAPFLHLLVPSLGGVWTLVAGVAAQAAIVVLLLLLAKLAASGKGVWLLKLVILAVVIAAVGAIWCRREEALLLIGAAAGLLAVAALIVAVLVVAVAWLFTSGLLKGLKGNGYGFCGGLTQADNGGLSALTDWLTGYFNDLAGLKPTDPPLSFGQLWGTDDPAKPREINLEVMTSAVSQQMVYSVPFRPGTPTFFYDPTEWARLFPKTVMDALERAIVADPEGDSGDKPEPGTVVVNLDGRPLRRLPGRAHLPVVVAIRMSLSFPVLLSAVPLYSIDWSLKENNDRKKQIRELPSEAERARLPLRATKIWFSDGGIGSNMPLHMFDALLPRHPTFAVNLKKEHPDYPIVTPEIPDNAGGRVYLAENPSAGRLRHWQDPDLEREYTVGGSNPRKSPGGGLVGFLLSIVDTMQNWRDEIMFPVPGFRDRIIQISQKPSEGGLNLDMPPPTIAALAGAGGMAALRLVKRFHALGSTPALGWEQHRRDRLATFLGVMQPGCVSLATTLTPPSGWLYLLDQSSKYDPAMKAEAERFVLGVIDLGDRAQARPSGDKILLDIGAPKPIPQVRIVPRI
ncbi:hypothetical protein CDN99_20415 [Roseateles aquatilis]|uniref:Uncharacterized protein n=1 Tax=Roseateles aquatilis TaxID=431061 RepID=A0A246J0W7_9BURK|nr:patatin-like phospholipase family protein [Roseateles aquatilis]OWQ86203.1 hypothetical protein CDN99_20415 [Roseateles aquatilis]